jgi:hypothetical protein
VLLRHSDFSDRGTGGKANVPLLQLANIVKKKNAHCSERLSLKTFNLDCHFAGPVIFIFEIRI